MSIQEFKNLPLEEKLKVYYDNYVYKISENAFFESEYNQIKSEIDDLDFFSDLNQINNRIDNLYYKTAIITDVEKLYISLPEGKEFTLECKNCVDYINDCIKNDIPFDEHKLQDEIRNVRRESIKYYQDKMLYIEPKQGFQLSYKIYMPENCTPDKINDLIVYATNTGGGFQKNGDFEEVLKKNIEFTDRKTNEPDTVKAIADRTGCPVLIPIIPRFNNYYTQQLSSYVLNNEVQNIIKKQDEVIDLQGNRSIVNTYINAEEQKMAHKYLDDLPSQITSMIQDAKKELKEKKNITVDDKVIMYGYSAGSKAANKITEYAINHNMDIVKGQILGGTTGVERLDNQSHIQTFIGNGSKDINNPYEKDNRGEVIHKETATKEEVKNIELRVGPFEGRFERNHQKYQNNQNITSKVYKNETHAIDGRSKFINDTVKFVNEKCKKNTNTQNETMNNNQQSIKSSPIASNSKLNQIKTEKKRLLNYKKELVQKKVYNTKNKTKTASVKTYNLTNKGYINVVFISLILIIITLILLFK